MGPTAQVNETVKQRRAPNVMPENNVYYACMHTLIPPFHIGRGGGGAGGRRRGGAGPPVESATGGRSSEAGGRKSLSQTRRRLISSRI